MKRDTCVINSPRMFGTEVPKIDKSNCRITYPMAKRQYHLLDDNGQIITKQVPILDKKKRITGYNTVSASEHYGIISLDDNLPIGNPVGAGYQLISNEQMFDVVTESLKGTSHEIVSVGTVADRAKVFTSVQLSDNIVAGNRETQNVLNFLWGHGGVFGVNVQSGFIVVVCANTFAMAVREGKKSEFKLRMKHTGNTELKIENMAKAIDLHYGVAAEFKQAMDLFATQSATPVEAKRIFAGYLIDDENIEAIPTRTVNTIERLEELFAKGAGNDGNDMSDVFNAFTDYYSHESSGGEDQARQFESSEFGSGAKSKTDAFELLLGNRVKGIGDLGEVMKRGEKVLQLV